MTEARCVAIGKRARRPSRRLAGQLLAALVALAAISLAGCALPANGQQSASLHAGRLAEIDVAIQAVVAGHKTPGAVFWLGHGDQTYQQAYGRVGYETDAAAVTLDTLFDAASLTKVIATAPSVLILAQEGRLDLEAPLVRYFPECANGGKEGITLRHLLTHTSGLPPSLPAKPAWHGDEAAHTLACNQAVGAAPGTQFRYSDINYVLLGQLVHRISGLPLNEFAQQRIYAPLKMADTGFLPLRRFAAARIAPTQKGMLAGDGKTLHDDLAPGQALQGVVHDPTARRMDGVAGSAGLFTDARDLARYARMLLGGGELEGARVFSPASVRLLTSVQSPAAVTARRAMGMDIDSPFSRPRGSLFPLGSYGHTGFTGCVLWVDPFSKTFYVFLSNRVYPVDGSNILPLYSVLGTLSAQAVADFDFSKVQGALPAVVPVAK
jgi:CubicO group peptidase (beta-lactamase class C family)